MAGGEVLKPGPLDLVHRHPVIPVCVPLRNGHAGLVAYDMMLPDYSLVVRPWPWAPFRDRVPRAGKCYPLASGAMVHVKPDCRCPK